MARDSFTGMFGVIVATVGSAVGLGNLWRFPYLVGSHGGAAFILIYLGFVVFLCLPVMIAEFVIGRRTKTNVMESFRILAPRTPWGVIGIISVLGAFCILAFYTVVGGWTLDYLGRAIVNVGTRSDLASMDSEFTTLVTAPFRPIIWTFVFVLLSALIVMVGIKDGIEKYSKVMMPFLFLMVIILAIRSVTLSGAGEGISFLLKPDFSKLTREAFLAALGQAFFSLSLGMGCMITYGSYIPAKEKLSKLSFITAMSDTLFALLAGFAIMPAVFAFGMSPAQGPGLLFIMLPKIFAQIPMGNVFAILFFVMVFLAAITSVISIMEVIVAYLTESTRMSRKLSVGLVSAVVAVFACLSSLSQGVLNNVRIAGKTIFDCFDFLSANILLPVGGLLVVLFVGWYMKKSDVYAEYTNEKSLKGTTFKAFYFLLRYVAPIGIAVVLVDSLI